MVVGRLGRRAVDGVVDYEFRGGMWWCSSGSLPRASERGWDGYQLEVLWIIICHRGQKGLIGWIYRSPDHDTLGMQPCSANASHAYLFVQVLPSYLGVSLNVLPPNFCPPPAPGSFFSASLPLSIFSTTSDSPPLRFNPPRSVCPCP